MNIQRRLLWFTGAAALALFVTMQFILAPLKPNVLALQLSFTAGAFQGVLTTWTAAGVAAYRSHFPYDFAFLLSYGAFGYGVATQTAVFPGSGRWSRARMRWLAPAAAFCDAMENVLHLILLSSPSAISTPAVALSATFSAFKWLLLAAFTASLGLALLRRGGPERD